MNSNELRSLIEQKIRQIMKNEQINTEVQEFSMALNSAVVALQGLSNPEYSSFIDDELRRKIEDLVDSLPSGDG